MKSTINSLYVKLGSQNYIGNFICKVKRLILHKEVILNFALTVSANAVFTQLHHILSNEGYSWISKFVITLIVGMGVTEFIGFCYRRMN